VRSKQEDHHGVRRAPSCSRLERLFEVLYAILRALLVESTESEAQLTIDEVTSIMDHISSHLDLTTVTRIRRIKKMAIASGKDKWMSIVRRPFASRLDVVAVGIEATMPEGRKRFLDDLLRGEYRTQKRKIEEIAKEFEK
jgi:uncharacterized protein YqiB (DUF1249 family)